jgi:phosphoribosylamine--glycine ligase
LFLPTVKLQNTSNSEDYKRIGEGDTGLNTGGMGAVSPVPYVDAVLMDKIETRIVKPTIEGLKDGIPYKGFVYRTN